MDLENNTIIKCTNSKDENYCTIIIKYRVCRNDRSKIIGGLVALKHKIENFLKDFVDDEAIFQNPVLKRFKDGILDLFKGVTALCAGVSPPDEMLTIPELPPLEGGSPDVTYEMKFVKGNSRSNMWLCYTKNGELINLLKRLRDKYDNNELEPFIFYPRIGEHVYFKQGANIFRGVVLEYVIPENSQDEDSVDIKVMNSDNSDIVVLSQNCFFHLDKEGTSLPMQCVLCALEDGDIKSLTNLSFPALKKHKLNVAFNRKKISVNDSPVDAQSVTINLSTNQSKDKKNEFNVNSKEFVPRNSTTNSAHASVENVTDSDTKSDQSTRSSTPNGSSLEDKPPIETSLSGLSIQNRGNAASSAADMEKKTVSVPESTKSASNDSKEKVEQKVNVMNNPSTRSATETAPLSNSSSMNRPVYEKERNAYRYATSKDRMNKYAPVFSDKLKNPTRISSPGSDARIKSGTPSTPSQPSQTQSPALPPNAQIPPYLFQSMPQFPSGPVHFPGQYVAVPSPQQLNSAVPFPFPQYPYATAPTYLSSNAAQSSAHSQYHVLPVSSPYQSYMQPVAMAPCFSSQPPFSQQFYQPSHLQQTWSHLQPSFHVTGSPQNAANHGNNVAGTAGHNNIALNKADSNAASISKFK